MEQLQTIASIDLALSISFNIATIAIFFLLVFFDDAAEFGQLSFKIVAEGRQRDIDFGLLFGHVLHFFYDFVFVDEISVELADFKIELATLLLFLFAGESQIINFSSALS